MTTVNELSSVAKSSRPELDSYRNCMAINQEIASCLESTFDIQVDVETGSISKRELRGFGPEHSFIVVSVADITEYEYSNPLIIDGALDQFCTELKEKGMVTFSIGSQNEFETVEIIRPSDKWYDNYTNWNIHQYR